MAIPRRQNMRTSKKELLITTAIDIIEREGLEALTYDSLSQATKMSKSGLIYHFPSRHAMLQDINDYLAHSWEEQLIDALDVPLPESTVEQRVLASLEVFSEHASLSDLLLTLDATNVPEYRKTWEKTLEKWAFPRDVIDSEPKKYLIHLIAAGLWIHDYISPFSLNGTERKKLIDTAQELLSEETQ
ncbi:TetR/AcrR family transcriptional regulator [Corynebacterium sp. sy039]|nr:TetR/AcrR family transcriptional regulator [Corynebacterium sp. sy039]